MPTKADRAMFTAALERDGYAILPSFVHPVTLAQLKADAETMLRETLADMEAASACSPRVTWWRLPTGEPYIFKIRPVLDLSSTANCLAKGVEIAELLSEFLGGRARLTDNIITYKQRVVVGDWAQLEVLDEAVHKHTDAAYSHPGNLDPTVMIAICIDDAPAAAGPVRVWPGSHRRTVPIVHTQDYGPIVPDSAAPDGDSVTLAASAGTLLAWDARMVHASGPNRSGAARRLLILGYARALQ